MNPNSGRHWFAASVWASLLMHALFFALMMYWMPGTRDNLRPQYVVELVQEPQAIRGVKPPEPAGPASAASKSAPPMAATQPAVPVAPASPAGLDDSGAIAPSRGGDAVLVPGVPQTRRLPHMDELLDDSVIVGQARTAPQGEGEESDGVTFDTKQLMYRGYMDLLRQKIEGIWVYPREAAERGIYGSLRIRFVIRKDGTLGSVSVERTSGYSMLDEAAVRALREAEPFWPIPDGWGRQSITIPGNFIYSLQGAHIR